jgi:hypothetical protein
MTRASIQRAGQQMEIDKAKVVELLRRRGLDERAEWVDRQLAARIDVDQHAGLLSMLRINPEDLADEARPSV